MTEKAALDMRQQRNGGAILSGSVNEIAATLGLTPAEAADSLAKLHDAGLMYWRREDRADWDKPGVVTAFPLPAGPLPALTTEES